MTTYRTIGIMSGTSLDGADLVLVDFMECKGSWQTNIQAAVTVPYPGDWQQSLRAIHQASAAALQRWQVDWSRWVAAQIPSEWKQPNAIAPLLIGCHGHTVEHRPQEGWTLQIGDGATLAKLTGIPVVNDFRQGDVALGGQGAPLVPLGDLLLFPDYRFCLNLGGIANISAKTVNGIIGADLTGCNTLLNRIALQAGMDYDKDGILAKQGSINTNLLNDLMQWPYLQQPAPKSLDTAQVVEKQWTVIEKAGLNPTDATATVCAFIGEVVSQAVKKWGGTAADRMLVTGGGAHHPVLIDSIRKASVCKVVLPERLWIDQKEAIIFAFLGLRRWLGQTTTLSSVTGASRDAITGAIHLP